MEVAEVGGPLIHWLLPCNWIPLGCHTIFGFPGLMHSF